MKVQANVHVQGKVMVTTMAKVIAKVAVEVQGRRRPRRINNPIHKYIG